jgi:hypothetical protein
LNRVSEALLAEDQQAQAFDLWLTAPTLNRGVAIISKKITISPPKLVKTPTRQIIISVQETKSHGEQCSRLVGL